ncbi:MAG: hypothetical protein AAF743_02800 [Planctomycetota bacterium]
MTCNSDFQLEPLNVDEGVVAQRMLLRMSGDYGGRHLLGDRYPRPEQAL